MWWRGEVVVEELFKLFGKGRDELRTFITDDLVVKSEVDVYFVEKESGYPLSGDAFLGGVENHFLCKAIVDHNQ